MSKDKTEYKWKDRKRWAFGLPWSFTRYRLTEEKLIIDTGFLNRNEEEVRLYRIMDISLRRTLDQRLFGLGTIHCCSADKSCPEFDIKRIRKSREIKDMLSDMVEEQRNSHRVIAHEYMEAEDDPAHKPDGEDTTGCDCGFKGK